MLAAEMSYSVPLTKMLPNRPIGPRTVALLNPDPWIPASEVPSPEATTRTANAPATMPNGRLIRPAREIFIETPRLPLSVLNVIHACTQSQRFARRLGADARNLVGSQPGVDPLQKGLAFLIEKLPKFR